MLQERESWLPQAQGYLEGGEWENLASLSRVDLESRNERSELAMLSAFGLFQVGDSLEARNMVKKALSWKMRRAEVVKLLLSGALNSLGRAQVVLGMDDKAQPLFDASSSIIGERLNKSTHKNSYIEQARQVRTALYNAKTLGEIPPKKSLRQIYGRLYNKVSDKWSFYFGLYDKMFARYRDQKIRFLEIGIQNGGSLEAWAQYFPNARTIIGCDINEKCRGLTFSEDNVSVVVGDASSESTKAHIQKACDNDYFDIIIDDGSHVSSDCIANFFLYFPSLRYEGTYVVEDVHCSYWQEFEGGLYHPGSTMAFFKEMSDLVNGEHWNNGLSLSNYLRDFGFEGYDSACLNEIYSVSFYNSVVVVEKKKEIFCRLGERVVVGRYAPVTDQNILDKNRSNIEYRDQSKNPYAQRTIE